MRIISNLVKVLSLAGFLTLAGMAVGAPEAFAKTAITPDVSAISGEVHQKLSTLPWYGVFDNLQYSVDGTVVTVSGQLVSEHSQTKTDAVNAVKSVSGVTSVVDNIEVLPPSPMDNQIRHDEYRTIFSQSDLGRYTMGATPQVHIVVKNGHVFLEGIVMDQMDKTVAGIAAKSVLGVFSVTNNLRVS